MAYNDPFGVYTKYGTERAQVGKGGEYRNNGLLREIEVKIDLTKLTEAETILDDNIYFPAGMRIAEVNVIAHTAAATGAAIDLGLIRTDRTTEIDYDGLLAAFPTASMNAAGETNAIVDNTTYDGALIGTTTAFVGHLTCSRTTATAFTAGVIYVRIRYYAP